MVTAQNLELFIEYAVGMFVLFMRLYARFKVFGYRNVQYDDFFTCMAILWWTLDTAWLQVIGKYGSSVGLTTETAALLDDETVHNYEIGDKYMFTSWVSYVCLIWSFKGIILGYYTRLTMGLYQEKLVKLLTVFCILSFTGAQLLNFCGCTPIEKSWQVKPYPGDHCVFRKANYITFPILNILTDIGLLVIPLPILFAARLPIYRKCILGVLFSSGVFVMIATILRTVYSLRSLQDLGTATLWASREYLVAAIVSSVPAIKPLFSRSRWVGSSSDKNSKGGHTADSKTAWSGTRSGNRGHKKPGFELGSSNTWMSRRGGATSAMRHHSTESEEQIINGGDKKSPNGSGKHRGIEVTTEIALSRSSDSVSVDGKKQEWDTTHQV